MVKLYFFKLIADFMFQWAAGFHLIIFSRIVKPIEAVARPKGLGLGADRSQLGSGQGDKKGQSDEGSLTLKRGTNCTIESGKYKGLYGLVSFIHRCRCKG